MMNIRRYCILLLTLTLGACIRNDIPYPVVSIDILSVQGEGFTCESSDIDTKNRIVTLHLDETTDISRVPISEITITEGGRSSIPLSGEFDLRADLSVVLSLYQDYDWTLRADQPIERFFTVTLPTSARPSPRERPSPKAIPTTESFISRWARGLPRNTASARKKTAIRWSAPTRYRSASTRGTKTPSSTRTARR